MVVIVMGVAGAGKTTVGKLLAASLRWEFHDADDLHHAANVEKMRAGIPLDDADRMPWLARVRDLVAQLVQCGTNAVVACSALKESYRRIIGIDSVSVKLVYLRGSRETIASRLARRTGHFMPPRMLESQFVALEEPRDALTVDIGDDPAKIAAAIRAGLGL